MLFKFKLNFLVGSFLKYLKVDAKRQKPYCHHTSFPVWNDKILSSGYTAGWEKNFLIRISRVDWVQWIRSNLGLLELLFHEKELAGGAALDPGGGEDATSQDGWRQNHGDGDDSRHLHGSRAGMFVRLQHAQKLPLKLHPSWFKKKDPRLCCCGNWKRERNRSWRAVIKALH